MKLEDVDARERESKAKWHYARAGKHPAASLSKGIKQDYEAQLLRRGVKDSQGEHTPVGRKEDPYRQQPHYGTEEGSPSAGTKVLHGFAFRD